MPCQLRTLVYVHENKICAALRIAIIILMAMTKGVEWGDAVCLNAEMLTMVVFVCVISMPCCDGLCQWETSVNESSGSQALVPELSD